MSRLIVKCLPFDMTEAKLRKLFSDQGTVTDCQLKYAKNGLFRGFGFVGFETENEAEKAQKYYNQTFVNTRKIQVEMCKPFGDSTKPRAWSKYSKESSAYKRLHPDEQSVESNVPSKKIKPDIQSKSKKSKDPKYAEFLEIHGKSVVEETVEEKPANSLVDELLSQILGDTKCGLLISGLPGPVKQKSIQEFLAPVKPKVIKIARTDDTATAFVLCVRMPDKRKIMKRNGEFFGGFKITMSEPPNSQNEESEKSNKNETDPEKTAAEQQLEEKQIMDDILESGRLFIRNLSYTCSENDIEQLVTKYGQLSDVKFPSDKIGKTKGFAIVTFMFPEHAVKAYSELDGTIFKGRMLHLLAGKESKNTENPTKKSDPKTSSFKEEKAAKQKSSASNSHNWNTLFLGANAVADAIAAKMDAKKSELLDSQSDKSLGVRMALGETRIVRETREFLLSHGVQLDAFSKPDAQRSNNIILVKNLPIGTDSDELRKIFSKYGEVGRLVLPPDGGISALIEFNVSQEAKAAFKALAYSRFKSVPLYLEWAPGEVFTTEAIAKNEEKEKAKKEADSAEKEEEATDDTTIPEPSITEPDGPEPETTLFVKNLNFETQDETLQECFEKCGRLVYATVSKKRDAKRPGQILSMGYGFVQFKRRADAQKAIKELQGTLLNGHSIELKQSHRDMTEETTTKTRKPVENLKQGDSTKLMVRNIPFQASEKELSELFGAFGELRSLRLPKKVSESGEKHKGFCFVDFLTKNDAKRAFDALCHSTHLYGRRLVLEWANESEGLEELRKKTAEHFETGANRKKRGKEKRQMMQTLEKTLDY